MVLGRGSGFGSCRAGFPGLGCCCSDFGLSGALFYGLVALTFGFSEALFYGVVSAAFGSSATFLLQLIPSIMDIQQGLLCMVLRGVLLNVSGSPAGAIF